MDRRGGGEGQRCARKVMSWVKGHSGITGNEVADYRAKERVIGELMDEPSIGKANKRPSGAERR